MPWCEPCGRFFNPNTLEPDGSCPSCRSTVAAPAPPVRVPWHFWVLVAGIGLYLGWRLIQMVGWLL